MEWVDDLIIGIVNWHVCVHWNVVHVTCNVVNCNVNLNVFCNTFLMMMITKMLLMMMIWWWWWKLTMMMMIMMSQKLSFSTCIDKLSQSNIKSTYQWGRQRQNGACRRGLLPNRKTKNASPESKDGGLPRITIKVTKRCSVCFFFYLFIFFCKGKNSYCCYTCNVCPKEID